MLPYHFEIPRWYLSLCSPSPNFTPLKYECCPPLEATGGLQNGIPVSISPSHQHPRGTLDPPLEAVSPCLPSSSAHPRSSSPLRGTQMALGCLGALTAPAKALHPLLPGPLELGRPLPQSRSGSSGSCEVGRKPGNKGQELACLWGGLECVLWSGLPGAQVSMSPELPLPLRGLPAHSTASEQGEGSRRRSSGMLESTHSGPPPSSGAVLGSFERLLPDQVAEVCRDVELDSWVLASSGPSSDFWDQG